jgi:Plasmid pRiA4b ORF-3-like protein
MEIYRVHVSLREIEPLIWRRIELSSTTTLKQFHRILHIAMGWEDYYLHEYVVDGKRYSSTRYPTRKRYCLDGS